MKTKWITLLGLALTASLFFTSCEKGCTNPLALNYDADVSKDDGSCEFATYGTLSMHLHHKAGTADFAFNTPYQDANGRAYMFTEARMYLSGFSGNSAAGNEAIENGFLLVKTDQMMYEVGDLLAGSYDGLTTHIGVIESANHDDPATYPLGDPLGNQTPNMNWGWANGYIFVMIEGKMDTTANMDGSVTDGNWVMHVGMDNLLREVSIDSPFEITEDGYMFHGEVDWAGFLEGIDLRTENSTHTMDNMPLAMKVANNAGNVLSSD